MEKLIFLLGLGSNLGDKEKNLDLAISLLKKQVGNITEQSKIYVSKPHGFNSKNDFLNCCLKIETDLTPKKLLRKLKTIERKMGRAYQKKNIYEDRIIDIDIILGQSKFTSAELQIPHPKYREREFVLCPLGDLTAMKDPMTFLLSSQLNY